LSPFPLGSPGSDAIGAWPSLTEGGLGQETVVDQPSGLDKGIGHVVVFKMKEIIKGVVEVTLGSAGAAWRRVGGALRGASSGRSRWGRGRTFALGGSRWGTGARVDVQSGTSSGAPPRLGHFQLTQPLEVVGRHRSIGTGLDQGSEQILRVLLKFHPVAGSRIGLSPGRGRAGQLRRQRQFLGEGAAEGL